MQLEGVGALLGALLTAACVGAALGLEEAGEEDDRLVLSARRHFPCPLPVEEEKRRVVEDRRYVVLEGSRKAPLRPTGRPGCYALSGKMMLAEELDTRNLQMKLMLRLDSSRSRPEQCEGFDDRGCGGHGSCLYCDICEFQDLLADKAKPNSVRMLIDGRRVTCGERLQPNRDHRLEVHFCLPTRKEFIERQGLTEDKWDKTWGALSSNDDRAIAAYIDVLIYDRGMEATQLALYNLRDSPACLAPKLSDLYKSCQKDRRKFLEPLFSRAIGCHRIWGSLRLQQTRQERNQGQPRRHGHRDGSRKQLRGSGNRRPGLRTRSRGGKGKGKGWKRGGVWARRRSKGNGRQRLASTDRKPNTLTRTAKSIRRRQWASKNDHRSTSQRN